MRDVSITSLIASRGEPDACDVLCLTREPSWLHSHPECAPAPHCPQPRPAIAIDSTLAAATAAASGNISAENSWPSEKPPGSREDVRYELQLTRTMWQSSEADANDRLGSHRRRHPPLTMLGRATACWRARGASGAGRARRGSSRSGWRLVCLRRDRASSSSSFLREAVAGAFGFSSATQVSPFSVSPLLHSSGQTRVVCLASSATNSRRHADIVGRQTFDRHIAAERRAGRRVQRSVDLAAEAPEPDQFGLRRANQLGRIGQRRRALGGFGRERIQRRNDRSAKPIAREGLGEGFQILDA